MTRARYRQVALCDAPWSPIYQAREDVSTAAWRAVMRITPEVAAQERQSIAEMIAHLERMKGESA